jgi:dTDP-4-amino-4,6-dideoxygalactose transaminase
LTHSVIHVGSPNIGDREKFLDLVGEIFDRRWLTNNGPLVQLFEHRIAEFLGVQHCVAMCNGTVALEIAIRALGMSGEIILPSYTFIATAHALHWQGITPVFADIDPETHNLDPFAVKSAITPLTTGIIGVHLWGRAAPVSDLQDIADEHGLHLMFDAAHAFGCGFGGRMIGTFGRAEVMSFHATKFFNTFEGGAVVTNDDELADKLRLMRNFGFAGYDNVIHPGTNGKMIEVCAAMGLVNLESIDTVLDTNRRNYACYRDSLSEIPGLKLMQYDEAQTNNYQYIVVEIDECCGATRDEIIDSLHAENVLARKYFWPGCHQMMPYRELWPRAGQSLPNTEKLAGRVIVLPTGTSVTEGKINEIGTVIRAICTRTSI